MGSRVTRGIEIEVVAVPTIPDHTVIEAAAPRSAFAEGDE